MNFSALSDRQLTESEKWNKYPEGVIPMWVADADYAVPSEIIEALKKRLEHPVLGYGESSQKLRELIVVRMQRLYDWEIQPEWICFTQGVVSSLNGSRAIMGDVGSQAITALPTYPHLIHPSPILQRPMQVFNMVNVNGRYTPDFDELTANITSETKMLILCNPHNPVGIVYNEAELQQFADIAQAHNLLICSDDIHADFPLYADKPYRPIATLSPEISQRTITLMAASKTFNIAGLSSSYAIIEHAERRQQFKTQLAGLIGDVNILGFIASEAAYEYGEAWHAAQIKHLQGNAEYCYERICTMPWVSMNRMEATFLAWVDAREISEKIRQHSATGAQNVHDYFVEYGVAISDGAAFGGPDFFRINLATSRELLTEGLNRIEQAIHALAM